MFAKNAENLTDRETCWQHIARDIFHQQYNALSVTNYFIPKMSWNLTQDCTLGLKHLSVTFVQQPLLQGNDYRNSCSKLFIERYFQNYSSSLAAHRRQHKKDNILPSCKLCGMMFNDRLVYNMHLMDHKRKNQSIAYNSRQ